MVLNLGWEAPGKNYITLGTCNYIDENIQEPYGRVIVLGIKSKKPQVYQKLSFLGKRIQIQEVGCDCTQ